jgi:hypothetical protein
MSLCGEVEGISRIFVCFVGFMELGIRAELVVHPPIVVVSKLGGGLTITYVVWFPP